MSLDTLSSETRQLLDIYRRVPANQRFLGCIPILIVLSGDAADAPQTPAEWQPNERHSSMDAVRRILDAVEKLAPLWGIK